MTIRDAAGIQASPALPSLASRGAIEPPAVGTQDWVSLSHGAGGSELLMPSPVPCPARPDPGAAVASSTTAEVNGAGSGPAVATPDRAARVAAVKARPWQDDIIYFALTDRFNDGDRTNDAGTDPSNPEKFHGGDWQGVIDKLDHLKSMGISAIWISPPELQVRDFFGMDAYHGYWPKEFFKTDPSFGDMAKLRELVDQAHDRGMKVVLDFVVNHTGYGAPLANDPDKADWFHHQGQIRYPTQKSLEQGSLYGLPDFAQENPDVSRFLIDMSKWWIDQTGIDGFRLDAARHVPTSFWQDFTREIHAHAGDNFLVLGEVYDPSIKVVSRYQTEGNLDSVFDFPLNYALRNTIGADRTRGIWDNIKYYAKYHGAHFNESYRVLRSQADGDMRRLSAVLKKDNLYRDPARLVTMLDNHDMTRFGTVAGPNGTEKLQLGLTLLFTMRGIPSVYYGTEVNAHGDWNDVRADMKFGSNPAFEQWFSHLASIRTGSEALRRGDYRELHVDRDVLAYARSVPGETVVVALNNGEEKQVRDIPVPASLEDGTILRDALSGETWTVGDGQIHIELASRQGVILEKVTSAVPGTPGTQTP